MILSILWIGSLVGLVVGVISYFNIKDKGKERGIVFSIIAIALGAIGVVVTASIGIIALLS